MSDEGDCPINPKVQKCDGEMEEIDLKRLYIYQFYFLDSFSIMLMICMLIYNVHDFAY